MLELKFLVLLFLDKSVLFKKDISTKDLDDVTFFLSTRFNIIKVVLNLLEIFMYQAFLFMLDNYEA